MEQVKEQISRINTKLQELLKKHSSLLKTCEQQQATIEKLQEDNNLKQNRIELLEQQQQLLKAAAGKMDEPDRKEFEQVINKYIREIDKCINLLND